MADERQTEIEPSQDFEAFYDGLFSDPRAVDGKQVVTGILQGAPAQEAIKEPKSPEEVIALVTEAYTAVSPEQFVEFAQQQIEATLLTQSRIVEGVMGDSIDRCGLDATESSGTPDRAEGTKSSLNYREQIDGFEIPAKEALERFESRLLAEAECVGIAGSRLRTINDMEVSEAGFADVLIGRVPKLTALDVEHLSIESKRAIVDIARRQAVEDLAALAVKVLEYGEPQSAGLMLALLPEVRDAPAVRSALQALVTKYKEQPNALTNKDSMYQKYRLAGENVLVALPVSGLVMGKVIVKSCPSLTGSSDSIEMRTRSFDSWDPGEWIKTEIEREARDLEREIREDIGLASGSDDFVRYARLRNPPTLGLASNCSSGYRTGITKREYLP